MSIERESEVSFTELFVVSEFNETEEDMLMERFDACGILIVAFGENFTVDESPVNCKVAFPVESCMSIPFSILAFFEFNCAFLTSRASR